MVSKEKRWWHDIAPPKDEDPVLILYLPWNLEKHGDVIPERRMWLLENFGSVLSVFEQSGFPVHMSYQRVDIDSLEVVCGFDSDRLNNLPLLSAPFSHALFGLIEDECADHVVWQIANGVQGNVIGENGEMAFFFPEWDIVSKPDVFFPDRKMVFPSVGAFATLYSDCAVGDQADMSVMQYDAIGVGQHVVVPMKGVDGFHAAWFAYQRDDSDVNLAAVIQSVRSIVEYKANGGKVVTLFVDGESILVGGARSFWNDYSLKGYELWERFFAALKANGLQRFFHGMERAYPRWNKAAAETPLPAGKAIGRQYAKWGGWLPQEKVKRRYGSLLPKKGSGMVANLMASWVAVSDRLSVLNTMELARRDKVRKFVDKDGVEFTLDFDATIPLVGWRAEEVLRGKGSFPAQMRKLRTQAAKKLADEGKTYGKAEEFTFALHEKLYLKYEGLDVQ